MLLLILIISCSFVPVFAQESTLDKISSQVENQINQDILKELENRILNIENDMNYLITKTDSLQNFNLDFSQKIEKLENLPPLDEQLHNSIEFNKILDQIDLLKNRSHRHTFPIVGSIGLVLTFFGFILMLRYWHDPYERHVENWINFIKTLYPDSYNDKIQRDFNYWRDYRDKSKPSPDTEPWLVPSSFAHFWRNMKLIAFNSMIIGILLQVLQTFWL